MTEETKAKRVAIVGMAPSWKEAPWADESYEIWVLNEMYKLLDQVPNARATRWFEIHSRNSASKSSEEHQNFLKNCPVPLYMWQKYDDLPNSVRFPKDEMLAEWDKRGYKGARYVTNSVTWMLAFAIYEGFEEIHVYGVDMAQDTEYGWQKPSCEYWIGLAEGLGIKVFIPQTSDLLKCMQLYGFESDNRNRTWIKTTMNTLKERNQQVLAKQREFEAQAKQYEIARAELRGAVGAYEEVLKRTQ